MACTPFKAERPNSALTCNYIKLHEVCPEALCSLLTFPSPSLSLRPKVPHVSLSHIGFLLPVENLCSLFLSLPLSSILSIICSRAFETRPSPSLPSQRSLASPGFSSHCVAVFRGVHNLSVAQHVTPKASHKFPIHSSTHLPPLTQPSSQPVNHIPQ
ncbi:hypothetical protein E2C01_016931 [Portunus trituberculatus]|uniref:Uncharacterized protein n=1 Tax=Portunus trituberculatus TaxID=210409 RepID=A0A5B7DS28_PORTR|nr:hypothetical protein [Portunus trituberculatus]